MKRPRTLQRPSGNSSKRPPKSPGDGRRRGFFSDFFGKKGPDPALVEAWLPPFVEVENAAVNGWDAIAAAARRGGPDGMFRLGTFDELGFFRNELDDIPDSEAKKPNAAQIKARERDRDFASKVLRAIQLQLHPEPARRGRPRGRGKMASANSPHGRAQ